MIKLDLGCGLTKAGGFIGLDRAPLPGVDVVADLNRPLPFADNSVALILASHALEHVADLLSIMREIYRVCKHGAQVCIVAPYYQQALNLANPYHHQAFNEHTPRFWTNVPTASVAQSEYYHPHAATWGLSESDNSSPGIDFRCLKMEFFYFPEYRAFSAEEKLSARKQRLDVCDNIMYHLLVIKRQISEKKMSKLISHVKLYEPESITIRKLRERSEDLELQLSKATQAQQAAELALSEARVATLALSARLGKNEQYVEEHEAELKRVLMAESTLTVQCQQQQNRIVALEEQIVDLKAKAEQAQAQCAERETRLQQARLKLQTRKVKFERLSFAYDRQQTELNQAQAALQMRATEAARIGRLLADQEDQLAQARRLSEDRQKEVEKAQAALSQCKGELAQAQQLLAAHALKQEQTELALQTHAAELTQAQTLLGARDFEASQTQQALQVCEAELVQIRETLRTQTASLTQTQQQALTSAAKLAQSQAALTRSTLNLTQLRERARSLADEAEFFRQRRMTRWLTRLLDRSDLLPDITSAAQQLIDDSFIFTPDLKDYRLQLSENLLRLPFTAYPLDLRRNRLSGILLAPVFDLPPMGGELGIEIISPDNQIVVQRSIPANQIKEQLPVQFNFPALADMKQGCFWLRVFARGLDVPVRVFEWQKWSWGGLGGLRTRAFCGFIFN